MGLTSNDLELMLAKNIWEFGKTFTDRYVLGSLKLNKVVDLIKLSSSNCSKTASQG